MRGVWSFWSKPFFAYHVSAWASEKHHLLAWVLSFETGRTHFRETALYTDDEGAYLLVDGLGLEFDYVSTQLNALSYHDPEWWMLGKLYAYKDQSRPFLHVDCDVFLWKPLPGALGKAQIFAQNPERFVFGQDDVYQPGMCDAGLRADGGWWPVEWTAYTKNRGNMAVCCGILGGGRTDFLNYYAEQAIRIIEDQRNRLHWSKVEKVEHNVLIEQYYLAACVEYYRNMPSSQWSNIRIDYLFDSKESAFRRGNAERVGYTHLIGGAKNNTVLASRLEKRVRREYPAHYERVLDLITDR